MKIRTCDGLAVAERLEDGSAVIIQPTYGARHEVGFPVLQLLELLAEPEELSALIGPDVGVPESTVNDLLRVGLLVDADAPERTLRRLLRPASPTFVGAPFGNPGTAAICVAGSSSAAELRATSTPPMYQSLPGTTEAQGWYDYRLGRVVLAGVSIVDCGDIPYVPDAPLEEGQDVLRDFVRTCHQSGSFPLILGGDPSATLSAVSAFSPSPIGVLHLDAHADLEHTGPQSVVRQLLGEEHVRSVVSVGLRGYLPWKEDPIDKRHRIIPMNEVRKLGTDDFLAEIPAELPWYVSLDASALDPSIAPGASVTVPGGFAYDEMRNLVESLSLRKLIGGDIVELNSSRDPANITARFLSQIAVALLAAAMDAA